uniref:Uncharacterized protein n=1 Tax=Avena sativa TaxID=4498 RepID=A0ACD5VW78_AVESA
MLFAAAGSVKYASDALQAEAIAMLHGVQMASQLGIGRVKLATDCTSLRSALISLKYDLSHVGAIFREIKFLLVTAFIDHQVAYVPRTCNKPAHTLAAIGLAGVQYDHQVWYDNVPVDVSRASVWRFCRPSLMECQRFK